ELRGRLSEIAAAQPDQLREIAVCVGEPRLEREALAQCRLGALERTQRDKAPCMGVEKGGAAVSARQHLLRDAPSFLVLAGHVEQARERLGRGGTLGPRRYESPVGGQGFLAATEGREGGDVLRGELLIRAPGQALGRGHRERLRGAAAVVVVTRKQQRRTRKGR